MPHAFSLIRPGPWYRREAFVAGFRQAGFEVFEHQPDRVAAGDILLIWNRYSHWHQMASRFESEGGTVLVAENGYLGKGGTSPKFDVHPGGPKPSDHYAIGLGFHNDAERVLPGGPERFAALGVELESWRTDGAHVLVAPNRSFGVPERMMDLRWPEQCVARLRKQTKREIRVRPHPGNDAPKRPLAEDLKGCWAVVVWSSSVAVHALAAGIPTFVEAPFQIVKGASASGAIESPVLPERLPHFQRMAHGQFSCAEIESGEPFRAWRSS